MNDFVVGKINSINDRMKDVLSQHANTNLEIKRVIRELSKLSDLFNKVKTEIGDDEDLDNLCSKIAFIFERRIQGTVYDEMPVKLICSHSEICAYIKKIFLIYADCEYSDSLDWTITDKICSMLSYVASQPNLFESWISPYMALKFDIHDEIVRHRNHVIDDMRNVTL